MSGCYVGGLVSLFRRGGERGSVLRLFCRNVVRIFWSDLATHLLLERSAYFLSTHFSFLFRRPGARTRTPPRTDTRRVDFMVYSRSKSIFVRLDASGKTVWITKIRWVEPSAYARYVPRLVTSGVDTAGRSGGLLIALLR